MLEVRVTLSAFPPLHAPLPRRPSTASPWERWLTRRPVACLMLPLHLRFQTALSDSTNLPPSFSSLNFSCLPTDCREELALCMAPVVLRYSATLSCPPDHTFLLRIFMATPVLTSALWLGCHLLLCQDAARSLSLASHGTSVHPLFHCQGCLLIALTIL